MPNVPLPFLNSMTGGGTQSPTLIPNFSIPVGSNGRGLMQQGPAEYLAANPRANASATVTVGGTVTAGDTVTITLTNGVFSNSQIAQPNSAVSVTYTVLSTDTLDTIAEALAELLNENALLRYYVRADAAGAVVTINWPGPVGNLTALAVSTSSGSTVTLTESAASLSGGSGPVYVWENFNWSQGGGVKSFFIGNFYDVSSMLSRLVQFGMPII
jgi:hypothetical protein